MVQLELGKLMPSDVVQLHLFLNVAVMAAIAELTWKSENRIINAVRIKPKDFLVELCLITLKKEVEN